MVTFFWIGTKCVPNVFVGDHFRPLVIKVIGDPALIIILYFNHPNMYISTVMFLGRKQTKKLN